MESILSQTKQGSMKDALGPVFCSLPHLYRWAEVHAWKEHASVQDEQLSWWESHYYLCTRTYAELSFSFRKMFKEQTVASGNNIIRSDIWSSPLELSTRHCLFLSTAGAHSWSSFARMTLYCQRQVSWTLSQLLQLIQGSSLHEVFLSWWSTVFFSLLPAVPPDSAPHQPHCSVCLLVLQKQTTASSCCLNTEKLLRIHKIPAVHICVASANKWRKSDYTVQFLVLL